MMQNKCYVIGLTGGIGTGKSSASAYLKSKGYPIVDADLIARKVVAPDEPAYNILVSTFGEMILLEDRTINRKKLGDIVFNDAIELEKLNQIMHPAIRSEITKQIKIHCSTNKVVIADIPLLFETGMTSDYDSIWLIYAPEETCVSRIMKRDNLSREAAIARIRAQIPIDKKVNMASVVFDNTKDIKALWKQLDQELLNLNLL